MADGGDLKTRQFAQVLSAVPASIPAAVQYRRFMGTVSQNALLRALLVGAAVVFVLLLVRPPFVMSFEHDKTRPWRGCSKISWLSVFAVTLLAAGAAALVPWLCQKTC